MFIYKKNLNFQIKRISNNLQSKTTQWLLDLIQLYFLNCIDKEGNKGFFYFCDNKLFFADIRTSKIHNAGVFKIEYTVVGAVVEKKICIPIYATSGETVLYHINIFLMFKKYVTHEVFVNPFRAGDQ